MESVLHSQLSHSFQMSLSIQQIILDAKRLAGRLKERESVADSLLNDTQAINKQIESMKQVRTTICSPVYTPVRMIILYRQRCYGA